MGNRKGIEFNNTREDFRSFCSNFPNVWKTTHSATILGSSIHKKGSSYAEIKAVEDNGFRFISIDTREYDEDSKNFIPHWEKKEETFASEIEKLKNKFNIDNVL